MDCYKVSVSDPAEDDLRDIARYISIKLASPATALNMVDAIDKAIDNLEEMPERYPFVPDDRLAAMGYRTRRVKNYLIFFIINKKEHEVDVARILYARRNWINIL